MLRSHFHRINWPTSLFLMLTLLVALVGAPLYLWHFGLDWFQGILFLVFFAGSGMSITLGYHRFLSHKSFHARWPVKLGILLLGSSTFEGSALDWCADHRRHHKYVDQDDDPYDITKGFFHAHMGWLLFKLRAKLPLENVADLQADKWVMWQHQYTHWIG